MIEHLTRVLAQFAWFSPVLLALAVGWAAIFTTRRGWPPGVSATIAAGAGWAAMAPLEPGIWRWLFWPRSTPQFLLLPAIVFVVAGLVRLRIPSRWIGFGAVCFAAWWLADSPAGRPQFWRIGFGGLVVAWFLDLVGASEVRMAVGVALTALCGLAMGQASMIWVMSLGVLVAAGMGVWLGRRDGLVAPGLTMMGLLGAELGGGRLLRGGVGSVDLACVAAIGAPLLIRRLEAGLRRRFGGIAPIVAVVLTGPGLAAVAWLVSRALRG